MLKNISTLGKTLSREELKTIQGSFSRPRPYLGSGCRPSCPQSCTGLNGVCQSCVLHSFGGQVEYGVECRIFA